MQRKRAQTAAPPHRSPGAAGGSASPALRARWAPSHLPPSLPPSFPASLLPSLRVGKPGHPTRPPAAPGTPQAAPRSPAGRPRPPRTHRPQLPGHRGSGGSGRAEGSPRLGGAGRFAKKRPSPKRGLLYGLLPLMPLYAALV